MAQWRQKGEMSEILPALTQMEGLGRSIGCGLRVMLLRLLKERQSVGEAIRHERWSLDCFDEVAAGESERK